jgi:cyclase
VQRVTPNVFTATNFRGCNPSYVVTSAGVVFIDTPQLPTKALEMRKMAEAEGPIRFVINTEHHVDHIFGNYFFKGAGDVVHHQGVADNFMIPSEDLDPFAYALEAIPTCDPEAANIVPDRDTYYEDPNRGDLVFTGDLDLTVGEKTFHLIHTPGHTPGQIAVYLPDERVVFTGDTVFSECQTWLMNSDVEQWAGALDVIASLDVDIVVPGHGPVTTPAYLATQRTVLLEWNFAVADAVSKGWSRKETVARIDFRDKFGPVDIGQGYMMDHIQTLNAGSLWDKFNAKSSIR